MFNAVRRLTVRSIAPMMARGNMKYTPMMQTQRTFSSQLHSLLVREFKEEMNNVEPNEELQEVRELVEKTFTIEDAVGSSVVYLRSNYKGDEIQIKFDCQDEQQADQDFDEGEFDEVAERAKMEAAERGEDVDDDEAPPQVTLFGFEVSIKKPDGSKIDFDCYTGKETFQIHHVGFVPAGVEDVSTTYTGPRFEDLDDKLIDGFYSYLTARKIDADINFFIAAYCYDKERREYINWLKNVGDFVYSKPQLK